MNTLDARRLLVKSLFVVVLLGVVCPVWAEPETSISVSAGQSGGFSNLSAKYFEFDVRHGRKAWFFSIGVADYRESFGPPTTLLTGITDHILTAVTFGLTGGGSRVRLSGEVGPTVWLTGGSAVGARGRVEAELRLAKQISVFVAGTGEYLAGLGSEGSNGSVHAVTGGLRLVLN